MPEGEEQLNDGVQGDLQNPPPGAGAGGQIPPPGAGAGGVGAYTTPANFRIQLQFFDPERSGKDGWISARAWVRQVDRAIWSAGKTPAGQNVWDDSMSASMAVSTLKGRAAEWVNKLELDAAEGAAVPELNNWPLFKAAFYERYVTPLTLSQQVSRLRGLRQGTDEGVLDFLDRVQINMHELYESAWVPDLENPETDRAAMAKGRATVSRLLFASGLTDKIREDSCRQASRGTTLTEFVDIARRNEQIEQDKKLRKAAATTVQEVEAEAVSSDSEAEVNVVHTKKGKGKGKGKGKPTPPPKAPKFQGKCWYCDVTGHKSQHCFKKRNDQKAQVSEMTGSPEVQMSQLDLLDYLNYLKA